MPTEYTLQELARLTGVTPRTIRYYIEQGLLPAPNQSGPQSRYGITHLERLRVIRKLQAAHLPLAEIRGRMRGVPDEQISAIAEEPGFPPQMSTAADYIRDVLGTTHARNAPPPEPPTSQVSPSTQMPNLPFPSASLPAPYDTTAAPTTEPERAHWERISLDPDIELHIRRPLSRQLNKRVERLITIARQLLEEE